MSLHEAFSELKFDKRMKDWNVHQGLLTEKELQDHLKTLEDVSDSATPLTLFAENQEVSTANTQESTTNEEQSTPQVNALPVDSSQQVFDPRTQTPHPTTSNPDVTPDRHVPLVHETFTHNPSTKETETTNEESNDNPWW